MNMAKISGSAFTAYQAGIMSLGQTDRAVFSTKTGSLSGIGAFSELLSNNMTGISESSMITDIDLTSQTEAYLSHLKEKYGVVRIESIGKDQRSLDRVGGTMGGTDVVIAPNMLKRMAQEPKTAQRIENTIDYFFSNIPKYEMEAAAMGLTFESCGCVVHEDGTVTYICGGGDPPEKVEEVNRINREKQAKRAAALKEAIERSHQAAMEREQQNEEIMRRMTIQEFPLEFGRITDYQKNSNIHFLDINAMQYPAGETRR